MTIQIIKFTAIIVAVVIIGVFGYCGTQCYVDFVKLNDFIETLVDCGAHYYARRGWSNLVAYVEN